MNELTLDDSQPVELFEFVSDFATYRYTSNLLNVVADSNTFLALSGLERGAIQIGTHENDKDEIKISMPIDVDVAIAWAFETIPPKISITIKRLDRAGGSTYVIWKGAVTSIEVEDFVAVFRCRTRFTSVLTLTVPNILVQPQCNHNLFDSRCRVTRTAYSFITTVSNIVDRVVTLATAGPSVDANYAGGELVKIGTNYRRSIASKAGAVVTLTYDMDLTIGDSVQVTQGCDKSWSGPQGCVKFANQPNFGAFPYVPGEDKNIFTVGVN
jgi:uncharacterized phage protein (TIGR02218 family)